METGKSRPLGLFLSLARGTAMTSYRPIPLGSSGWCCDGASPHQAPCCLQSAVCMPSAAATPTPTPTPILRVGVLQKALACFQWGYNQHTRRRQRGQYGTRRHTVGCSATARHVGSARTGRFAGMAGKKQLVVCLGRRLGASWVGVNTIAHWAACARACAPSRSSSPCQGCSFCQNSVPHRATVRVRATPCSK